MIKLGKKLLIVVLLFGFLIFVVPSSIYAVDIIIKAEQKDTYTVQIESKEKTASNKITWNGNGGKISSKKTVSTFVKRGSSLKKLSTPKRSGYAFKGWFTQKTGGKKINKYTKPAGSVTYYAQWKRALTNEEKKLVGRYVYGNVWTIFWQNMKSYGQFKDNTSYVNGLDFKSDGTFNWVYYSHGSTYNRGGVYLYGSGNWQIPKKGTVRTTNYKEELYYKDGTNLNQKYKDSNYAYVIKEEYGIKGIKWTTSKYSYFFSKY